MTTDGVRGGFVRTWVRHHPAPRYLVAGGVTLAVDVGGLRLLHGTLGVELLLATSIAFIVAAAVNFSLNRHWSFGAGRDARAHRQFARYLVLLLLNLLSTVVIVGVLAHLGIHYLLAKLIAAAVNAVATFFAFERWVFAAPEQVDPDWALEAGE